MPAQTHIRAKLTDVGKNTIAYWSVAPTGKVLVFVHGFRGSSTGTWEPFPDLLQQEAACAGCDLVFYGYDSEHKQPNSNGANLRAFLKTLAADPGATANPWLPDTPRPAGFRYARLLLVGHSLGAVVARRALLDGHLTNEEWVRSTRLLLFAPAHMGARRLWELAKEALGWLRRLGRFMGRTLEYKIPPLVELKPGSPTLKALSDDTKDALAAGPVPYLVAQRVVFGDEDRVVRMDRFCADPPLTPIRGKGHQDVCKPEGDFRKPVTHVVEVL